jgi:hypothetical protein
MHLSCLAPSRPDKDVGSGHQESFALSASTHSIERDAPLISWLRPEDYWSALVLLCALSFPLISSIRRWRSRLVEAASAAPFTDSAMLPPLSNDHPRDISIEEMTLPEKGATTHAEGAHPVNRRSCHIAVQDYCNLFYAVDFAPRSYSDVDVDFMVPIPWNLSHVFYLAPDTFFAPGQTPSLSSADADSNEPRSFSTVGNASPPTKTKEPVPVIFDSQGSLPSTDTAAGTIQIVEHASIKQGETSTLTSVVAADPLQVKLEQLLNGFHPSGDEHCLERGRYLPALNCLGTAAISKARLDAIEDAAHLARHRGESLLASWLLAQTTVMRLRQADKGQVDMLHARAMEFIQEGCAQADPGDRAFWNALRVTNDLALLQRQNQASRLLGLRHMRISYNGALSQGSPAIIEAWIAVLLFEAEQTNGHRQLVIYDEAEALCKKLADNAEYHHDAHYLHAKVLMQRVRIGPESQRATHLSTALGKLNAAFEAEPRARTALAIAKASLDQSRYLLAEEARQALSHARKHAALAAGDPGWKTQSLPCILSRGFTENLAGSEQALGQGPVATTPT